MQTTLLPRQMSSVVLFAALVGCAQGQPVVPTDGMVISQDTVFVPGVYSLPHGVSIGAGGVDLDMNGATLVGTGFNGYGVTCLAHADVTIRNGVVRNYYYGIRAENAERVQILDCNLSDNYVDPLSHTPQAPFLNINAGPNLGDRTNLGGGIFLRSTANATLARNTLRNQENGIDLYFVTDSMMADNDASDNTGWGIHLYDSDRNQVLRNHADRCTRPGLLDSAGFLVVYDSEQNVFRDNSFQFSGDGLFIGNENGCPSNDNLFEHNDGSFAGANAFEATFSSGNQFINNNASGSNYGFWLGYSHSGNIIRGNTIRANNTNGIEIEHGQHNTIEGNTIAGNGGKAIVLRTDGQVHLPPNQFPCLMLPDQAASSFYTIRDNIIHSNFGRAIELTSTTDSTIVNNLVFAQFNGTCSSNGARNVWSLTPTPGTNIVGGPALGGNYWSNYAGQDTSGDGLGDTLVPYTNNGQIVAPGDPHPLIGNPDFGGLTNPGALCDRSWQNLGRNTRANGQVFDTTNGAHFATDGTTLFLLEGSNSQRLSRFNATTRRYEPRANAPQGVQDGGDFQYGGALYFATVGLSFDQNTGAGNGSVLLGYNLTTNAWSALAPTSVSGHLVSNEALAFDPVGNRLYATIVAVLAPGAGGDITLLRKLAIYNPATNAWLGATSAGPDDCAPGSEAEYLDGKIYVWRGGSAGGAVNGTDSYLNVYDIAGNTWSQAPSLQASGVIPGFRSGGFDVWGVSLSSDAARRKIFVFGAETNRQLYVFDVATQSWGVARTAPYDGGWGSSIEYVSAADRVYLIDGRAAAGTPQGTAALVRLPGDLNQDCTVNLSDLTHMLSSFGVNAGGDVDCDGVTGLRDLTLLLSSFGWSCP